MPNTTRGYPYPADTDPADVPADMQAALQAVDADVTGVEATADGAVAGLASTDATVSGIQTNVDGLLAQNLNARLLDLEGAELFTDAGNTPVSVAVSGRTASVWGNLTQPANNQYTDWPAGVPDWVKNAPWGSGMAFKYGASGTPDVTNICAIFLNSTGIRWYRSGLTLATDESVRFLMTQVCP